MGVTDEIQSWINDVIIFEAGAIKVQISSIWKNFNCIVINCTSSEVVILAHVTPRRLTLPVESQPDRLYVS